MKVLAGIIMIGFVSIGIVLDPLFMKAMVIAIATLWVVTGAGMLIILAINLSIESKKYKQDDFSSAVEFFNNNGGVLNQIKEYQELGLDDQILFSSWLISKYKKILNDEEQVNLLIDSLKTK